MSTIGRTFSVLNLVLAALFLGWAANTLNSSQDYRDQLQKAQNKASEDIAALEEQLAAAQGETKSERSAKDQYKDQRDDFEANIERLNNDLAAEKADNAQLRSAVSEIQSTHSGASKPNCDRSASLAASGARGPSRASTGSPGVARSNKKTTVVMVQIIRGASSSRVMM